MKTHLLRLLVTLLTDFIYWTRIKPYYDAWECAIHRDMFMRRVGAHGRICAACHLGARHDDSAS